MFDYLNWDYEDEARSILRGSPRTFLIFGLIAYLATGNVGFLFLSIYVLATEIITNALKTMAGESGLPDDLIKRPDGSGVGCGTFIQPGKNVSNQIGMPSGHTAAAAMFVTFLIAKIWSSTGYSLIKIFRTVMLIALAAIVMISRTDLVENCHTWLQALSGAFVGIVLGLLFWWFDTKILRNPGV
jgi:membrane-associated phospholipid phosphatase